MPWIFWWRKPPTPAEGGAGLPGEKQERITVCIGARDSSSGAKSAQGIVLPPASAEGGRERFFRRRHSMSSQLLRLGSRSAPSCEPVTVEGGLPSRGQPLLLEGDLPDYDPSKKRRSAYFKRGCYAVSEPQGMRLCAPAITLSAARLLSAGRDCGAWQKSGTDE
jgi:hypothetical protein